MACGTGCADAARQGVNVSYAVKVRVYSTLESDGATDELFKEAKEVGARSSLLDGMLDNCIDWCG